MVITLASEKPRKRLLEKGSVMVFRTSPHSIGKDWMTDRKGQPKICDVTIRVEQVISRLNELEPYVSETGFDTFHEWLGDIRKANPGIKSVIGYLYEILKN